MVNGKRMAAFPGGRAGFPGATADVWWQELRYRLPYGRGSETTQEPLPAVPEVRLQSLKSLCAACGDRRYGVERGRCDGRPRFSYAGNMTGVELDR